MGGIDGTLGVERVVVGLTYQQIEELIRNLKHRGLNVTLEGHIEVARPLANHPTSHGKLPQIVVDGILAGTISNNGSPLPVGYVDKKEGAVYCVNVDLRFPRDYHDVLIQMTREIV